VIPLLLGCGEYVCLAPGETLDAEVTPLSPGETDLSGAARLRHFGLDAVLRLTTAEGEGPYGGRGVDYDAITGSAEATAALSDYLAALATVDPSALQSPGERLAYWLNAYNGWVLYGVSAAYAKNPDYDVESDGWLLFSSKFITVDGHPMTPNDIEHGVLRGWVDQPYGDDALAEAAGRWHEELWAGEPPDARLHAGLNCASASCPDVPPGAFQGARVDEQLDALAVTFLANEEKGAGPAGLSTLFSWFAGDFEASHGSVAEFVRQYRDDSDVDYATFLPYDWSLNASGGASEDLATCASPW